VFFLGQGPPPFFPFFSRTLRGAEPPYFTRERCFFFFFFLFLGLSAFPTISRNNRECRCYFHKSGRIPLSLFPFYGHFFAHGRGISPRASLFFCLRRFFLFPCTMQSRSSPFPFSSSWTCLLVLRTRYQKTPFIFPLFPEEVAVPLFLPFSSLYACSRGPLTTD